MLLIIGGGKMGTALLEGLTREGREVGVVERDPDRRAHLEGAGHRVLPEPVECDGAVIAVKPIDVEPAVSDATSAGAPRILSVAAGVTLARLHASAGPHTPVLRAMPNLGAVVGRSATALCAGQATHTEDVEWAEGVLRSVGTVVRVTEEQIDAVTGLSGSGPAYLFLVAEALAEAGVGAGLSHDAARRLTAQTMAGAAELLMAEGASTSQLRADVTTPGGTTAAGLRVLEQRAVRAALIDAVAAASQRSAELGRPGVH